MGGRAPREERFYLVLDGPPEEGDSLYIPEHWRLVVDVPNLPIFDKVTNFGTIVFDNELDEDIHFQANIIFNRGGNIEIGTVDEPFKRNAKITLHGARNSEPIAISPDFDTGNKIIANTGTIKMYGNKRTDTLTRLHEPALKGSTSIMVAPGLEIFEGDRLGLPPTSFDINAGDYANVTSYDTETGEITLEQPLEFYHWGAPESTGDFYNGVDMRGEVVILSRNIVIKGTSQDNWGCQMLSADVTEYDHELNEKKFESQLILHSVEFDTCSQPDTERAALRIFYSVKKPSEVKHSSFHSGLGWGGNIYRSERIVLENNIWFGFRPVGVAIDHGKSITFKDNFVGFVQKRTTFKAEKAMDKECGVCVCSYQSETQTCPDVRVHDNIVAGASYAGFIGPGHKCNE